MASVHAMIGSGFALCLAGKSGGSVDRSQQVYGTISCRASEVLRALEVLKQVCLKRIDLSISQGAVHDLSHRGRRALAGAYGPCFDLCLAGRR